VFGNLYNGCLEEKDLLSFVGKLKSLIDFLYKDSSFLIELRGVWPSSRRCRPVLVRCRARAYRGCCKPVVRGCSTGLALILF